MHLYFFWLVILVPIVSLIRMTSHSEGTSFVEVNYIINFTVCAHNLFIIFYQIWACIFCTFAFLHKSTFLFKKEKRIVRIVFLWQKNVSLLNIHWNIYWHCLMIFISFGFLFKTVWATHLTSKSIIRLKEGIIVQIWFCVQPFVVNPKITYSFNY